MLHSGVRVGSYRLERLVGTGGTAEVWSARHVALGARRALKVLTSDAGSLALTEGEAQSLLASDHVVPVLDVVRHDGRPVLVMPLVEGPTLRDLVVAEPLDEDLALALFLDVLTGVRAIHAAGIVHGDLKPANVLLHREADRVVAKVTDFGAAVRVGEPAPSGWGTRPYAAPELRAGHPPTPAVDLFALGVILHELLTGRRPAGAVAASVRPRWGELLDALLAPEPDRRLSDAATLRRRLEALGVAPARPTLRHPRLAPFAGEPTTPTTMRPAGPVNGGLPRLAGAFVGRTDLVRTVGDAVRRAGLVTLLGPGGVGKTRLAVLAASDVEARRFVDLTEARTADDLVREVARALALELGPSAVEAALRGHGRLVLLLDNLEQIPDAGPVVARWIAVCPDLTVLATSRRPVGVDGELRIAVEPLCPDDARSLFVARAADPDLVPGPLVDEVVALLDGLPLALELAAARIGTMTLAEMRERLEDRFAVMVSRAPGLPDRHRTLEGTLDWSWSLLTPDERSALAQLSVFEGGFTLQAAEAVVQVPGRQVERLLGALVDRSLLQTRQVVDDEDARLTLLSSVQRYAAARLAERGDGEEVARRHAAFYVSFQIDELRPRSYGPRRDQILRDLDNHRAVLRRAVEWGDAGLGTRAAELLVGYGRGVGEVRSLEPLLAHLADAGGATSATLLLWGTALVDDGRLTEARERLEATLQRAVAASDPRIQFKALRLLEEIAMRLADLDRTGQLLEQMMALAHARGSREMEMVTHGLLSPFASRQGDEPRAIRHAQTCLSLAVELGDLDQQAKSYNNLGVSYSFDPARRAETREAYTRALGIREALGLSVGQAWVLQNLAALDHDEHRDEEALARLEASRRLFLAAGDRRIPARRATLLARIRERLGDPVGAIEALDEALDVLRELEDAFGVGMCLVERAELLAGEGRVEEGRADYEEARGILGGIRMPSVTQRLDHVARRFGTTDA